MWTMKAILSSLLLLLACLCPSSFVAANNILLLGDSWAEFAGTDILEDICPDTTVVNIGDGGTTAFGWSRTIENRLDVPEMQGFVPDYAWISMGALDYIYFFCRPLGGARRVADNMRTVMAELSSRYPGIRFLLTGFGIPSDEDVPCSEPEIFFNIMDVFVDFDFGKETTVALVHELFGGTLNETTIVLSDAVYYADDIHLNDLGYTRLFEYEPVYNALGCAGPVTDSPTSSPAPTIPPTPSPNPIAFCFSGENQVLVQDRGSVPMSELMVGDRVQVNHHDTYEPIYAFGHYNPDAMATFLQIYVNSTEGRTKPLELTPGHMILTAHRGFVPASSIQVQDMLVTTTTTAAASSLPSLVVVTEIRSVTRKGVYAPFTSSGTIVVNDVIASNYVSFQPEASHIQLYGYTTPLSFHALSHAFLTPYRVLSSQFIFTNNATPDGILAWVVAPYDFATWIFQQGNAAILLLVFGSICLAAVLTIGRLASVIVSSLTAFRKESCKARKQL